MTKPTEVDKLLANPAVVALVRKAYVAGVVRTAQFAAHDVKLRQADGFATLLEPAGTAHQVYKHLTNVHDVNESFQLWVKGAAL